MSALLRLDDVCLDYGSSTDRRALTHVNLDLTEGECTALVGESGSGKTSLASIILGLLPNSAHANGHLYWKGSHIDLLSAEHHALRGTRISYVPQDALRALNPALNIREHFKDTLRHVLRTKRPTDELTCEWLTRVSLKDPESKLFAFPHQLSGGERQRVLIALAMVVEPELVILDECTTALDVSVQAEVLSVLEELHTTWRFTSLFISHDLAVVSRIANRVDIIYVGQIVESGPIELIRSYQAYHPYSKGLLAASLRPDNMDRALPVIEGALPKKWHPRSGCVFLERCPFRKDDCKTPQRLIQVDFSTYVRCHRVHEIAGNEWPTDTRARSSTSTSGETRIIVNVRSLTKEFSLNRKRKFAAVNNVTISLMNGMTLGIVGESGSGKSTLARLVTGIIKPTHGRVEYFGQTINDPRGTTGFPRGRIQLVFQDPSSSLNPRIPIGKQIRRGLLPAKEVGRTEGDRSVHAILEDVRLTSDQALAYPHELSGGEQQRASIARALIGKPDIVVLDEPVTALDVSVQASILNLLDELKARHSLTYVLISHDLGVVRYLADNLAVMKDGYIVEMDLAEKVWSRPSHPYTKGLIDSTRAISV